MTLRKVCAELHDARIGLIDVCEKFTNFIKSLREQLDKHVKATESGNHEYPGPESAMAMSTARFIRDEMERVIAALAPEHTPEVPRLSMTREEMDKFLEENHKRIEQWPNSMVQEGDAP